MTKAKKGVTFNHNPLLSSELPAWRSRFVLLCLLGGSAARSEVVRRAFCHEGEQIACWVIAGTLADAQAAAPTATRPPAPIPRDLLGDWTPDWTPDWAPDGTPGGMP